MSLSATPLYSHRWHRAAVSPLLKIVAASGLSLSDLGYNPCNRSIRSFGTEGQMHAPTPAPPALIGRDRELAILWQHLDAALGGHGSLVLIGGAAGIGKTALA